MSTERTARNTPTPLAVRQAARSFKSARQLAAELGCSKRTIERRLNELRAAGRTVLSKTGWDGEYKHVPYYRCP